VENTTYGELISDNERLRKQIDKYKETIKLYEHHFEKANMEFKQMQEETRYMKQSTDEMQIQMKRLITEYNNVVAKHREIEEAFMSISYLAKTSPQDCISKLISYYDEFQSIVTNAIKDEEKCEKERTFTIIKGGK